MALGGAPIILEYQSAKWLGPAIAEFVGGLYLRLEPLRFPCLMVPVLIMDGGSEEGLCRPVSKACPASAVGAPPGASKFVDLTDGDLPLAG